MIIATNSESYPNHNIFTILFSPTAHGVGVCSDSVIAERLVWRPVAGWMDFNSCTTVPLMPFYLRVIYQLPAPYSLPSLPRLLGTRRLIVRPSCHLNSTICWTFRRIGSNKYIATRNCWRRIFKGLCGTPPLLFVLPCFAVWITGFLGTN